MLGNLQQVLTHDAPGNTNELGVGSVVEQQIFAEIVPSPAAEAALQAWRGVGRHHAHSFVKTGDLRAYLLHDPCQLVPEDGGWRDHPCVSALAVYLQIRAAGERSLDTDQYLIGRER